MIIEIGKVVTSVSSKSDFLNRLLGQIGKAKLILIGDASHGTEEFYQTRIEITKHLIMKKVTIKYSPFYFLVKSPMVLIIMMFTLVLENSFCCDRGRFPRCLPLRK